MPAERGTIDISSLVYLNGKKDGETDLEPISKRRFQNMGEYAEWKIRAGLGIYPRDHPVSNYAQSALLKIGGPVDEDKPRITVYRGSANAFVFPNGSIYLSDGLLLMADTEEEILFTLMHERIHHLESHIEKVFNRADFEERTYTDLIFGGLGQKRAHEWEGDLRAFDELERLGINPMGGVELLEKFRQDEETAGGLVHGRSTDRALNLRTMTYIKDLKSIDQPLHPIPPEVKQAVGEEKTRNNFGSLYDEYEKESKAGNYFKSLELIEKMDLNTALLTLQRELNQYDFNKTVRNRKDIQVYYANFQKNTIPILETRVRRLLTDATQLSDIRATYQAILNLTLGIDSKNFAIENTADLNTLLQTLKPETFQRLGLKIKYNPDHLTQVLFQTVFDKFIFEEEEFKADEFLGFVNNLVNSLNTLYQEESAVEFEPQVLYKKIIDQALNTLDRTDGDILKNKSGDEKMVETAVEEKINEAQLERFFMVYRDFAKDLKAYLIGSSGNQKLFRQDANDKEFTAKYIIQLKNLFGEMPHPTSEEFIKLLANFRKILQENDKTLNYYFGEDEYWHAIILDSISDISSLHDFTNIIESKIFELKIALILSSVVESEILSSPTVNFSAAYEDDKFDLGYFRTIYNLTTDENYLAKETGVEMKATTVYSTEFPETLDRKWLQFFKSARYDLLQRDFKNLDRRTFNRNLETLTTEFPINNYGPDMDLEGVQHGYWINPRRAFLNDIFAKHEFDLTNTEHLRELYYACTYFEDYALAIRLQNLVMERMGETFSYHEGLTFLENELAARRLISLRPLTDFVEEKAVEHGQIDFAREKLAELLTDEKTFKDIGKLVTADEFVEKILRESKDEFLLACMGNGTDDSLLKRFLYKRWVASMNYMREETDDKVRLDTVLNRLYRLDAQSKYLLIRNLLTGDNGILVHKDKEKRQELVNYFLDNFVQVETTEEKKFMKVIKEVMTEIVKTADYDLLYFAIAPLIQERMLILPPEKTTWQEIIKTEEPPDGFGDEIYIKKSGEWVFRPNKADADELLKYIRGRADVQKKETDEELLEAEYEGVVEKILGGMEALYPGQKMSVNEFLLETAQKLGAVGKRFLQIIGQYISLPPHLEEAFYQVYDRTEGQSKITAHQTLLREWPAARDELAGIYEGVGGGSLMSVFRTENRDGQNLALKILNPNAAHHTDTTHELLTEVFTQLTRQDEVFAPSVDLLTDIQKWIKEDIDFTGFLEMDSKFRRQNNGYTIGGKYRIKIPKSYQPENKYFAQDEFIVGINLTEMKRLKAEGHDLKEVVSLVVRNFLEQIKRGLVHSDMHPGNIRVTPNMEVAYLDRNYYLQLSLKDRLFLKNLAGSMDKSASAVKMCINYIKDQGVSIDNDLKQTLIKEAESLNNISDPTDRLMRLAVLLRKEGLKFPLKTTLLIKDFFYLDRLAKRVGFSGITEATGK